MLRWARGKTRLDHIRNDHIRKEAHVKPVETFLQIGSFEKEQRSRYYMSRNGYVPKWLCPETAMSRNGYVPKWLCPETVMSRSGYVPTRLCHEVAICPEMVMSRNVRRSCHTLIQLRLPQFITHHCLVSYWLAGSFRHMDEINK